MKQLMINFFLMIAIVILTLMLGLNMVKEEKEETTTGDEVAYAIDECVYENAKYIQITVDIVKNLDDQEVE